MRSAERIVESRWAMTIAVRPSSASSRAAWTAASEIVDSQWPLIVAWLLLVGIGLVIAWRIGSGHLRTATRALNAVALFLVVSGGMLFAFTHLREPTP